ncbi:hypothetical protein WBJ53_04730 [Spirosoma sp. SC4-14]|uniref:hypothetical protein n=1 Tax=Spirosoma sp. SC4-14 TaxID=3128900 RepID=UPI0030CB25B7
MKKEKENLKLELVELVQKWAQSISLYDQNYRVLTLLIERYKTDSYFSQEKTNNHSFDECCQLLFRMQHSLVELEREWDQFDSQLPTQEALLNRHIAIIQDLNHQMETAISHFGLYHS